MNGGGNIPPRHPMRDRFRLCLVWLLLIAVVPSVSARAENRLLADHTVASWTDRDNLPSARIWAIDQDASGYLWIGNDAGVFRFDGVRFVPLDTLVRLQGERPEALMASSRGDLWLGFGSGTIGVLRDGQLQLFGEREGAPRDGLFSFMEDHTGTIWACSADGLFRFQGARWERVTAGLPQGPILTIREDHKHQLWVATRTSVLKRAANDEVFAPVGLVDFTGFLGPWFSEDASGAIWMTDRRQGFRRIDPPEPVRRPDVRGSGVHLVHDRKGALWIATPNSGLWRARPDAQGSGLVVDTITTKDGLLSNAVRALHEDREGNIWVGTYAGLQRFTPRRVASITDYGFVRTMIMAPDGSLWLAAASGLIRRTSTGSRVYDERDGVPGPTVLSFHLDDRGVLWIGTDRGVARLEGDRFVPVQVTPVVELSRPMSILGRHQTWVRDIDQGWMRFTNGLLTPGAPFGAGDRAITSIRIDRRDRLWFGTPTGVTIADPRGETTKTVELPIGRVLSMYETATGQMWVGGVAGLSLVSDKGASSIARRNGLPSNVFSMVDDATGSLWLAVNGAIVRLTREEFDRAVADPTYQVRYRLFDASDGSAGIATRSSVAIRDDSDKVWFTTSVGLTVIDPTQIGEPRPAPPIRIESVVADRRSFDLTDGVDLPARTSHLQIEYTSLMLTDPTRVRFRYRLDGFDRDWNDVGTARQAIYTNLPPGEYRFQVLASSIEDNWSGEPATWGFTILPTFYQTRVFYGFCIALAALLAWTVWHLRVRRVRKEFALVLAERIRMSRAIHDTLLQGLVGLALQFNDLARSLEAVPSAGAQLARIRRQIEEYIREARSSIWDLRSPRLEKRDLPAALRDVAEKATAGTNTAMDFSVIGTPRHASSRVEEQLLVIGQEAISNAIRHSEAHRIRVELRYDTETIGVRVTDDGHGFDVETARRTPGHYGLVSMNERAEEVRGSISVVSAPGRGTEIDAVVPAAS